MKYDITILISRDAQELSETVDNIALIEKSEYSSLERV